MCRLAENLKELSICDLEKINKYNQGIMYNKWRDFYVNNLVPLREPFLPSGSASSVPIGYYVFYQLTRLFWIQKRAVFEAEAKLSKEECESKIMSLVEKLPNITSQNMAQFEDEFESIWFQLHENEELCLFASFFMGDIIKRFRYHELLKLRPIQMLPDLTHRVERTEQWIRSIVTQMAEEAFTDMYCNGIEYAYKFPGDDEYFAYKWPNKVLTRASCLHQLRPHLVASFYSETNVSRETVLAGVYKSHVARHFILNAISEHIQMHTNGAVKWLSAVVIPVEALQGAFYQLSANLCPLIVQIFSGYWVYDGGCVHPSDNIYETIALWIYLLETKYNFTLHGHNLKKFIF